MGQALKDRVAVVTGGGNGIGRATVLRFLEEGARVVVADVNETTAAETLELAAAAGHGDHVRFVRCDVTSEEDVAGAVATAERELGGLDCMFNNAGVAGAFGPITQQSVEDWDYTFAVLVRGVFLGVKHAARAMKRRGGGSILNTASVAGLSGGDGPQAYSAAKAAVINLTRAAAIELAEHRIRVNAICPGGILTPLVHRGNPELLRQSLSRLQPWPEAGLPEHIAGVAVFLAGDDSRFVTGAPILADGGLVAAGPNSLRGSGGGGMFLTAPGVDRGSTGLPPELRVADED